MSDSKDGVSAEGSESCDRVQKWLRHVSKLRNYLRDEEKLDAEEVEKWLGDDPTPKEMAVMFRDLRMLHEVTDELKKEFSKLFDWYRVSYVPDKMEDIGSSVKIPGVGRLGLTDDLRVKVLDKEEAHKWLEEERMGDMITETVNASTLKASLRRRVQQGKEVPDRLFKLTPFTRANLTKV